MPPEAAVCCRISEDGPSAQADAQVAWPSRESTGREGPGCPRPAKQVSTARAALAERFSLARDLGQLKGRERQDHWLGFLGFVGGRGSRKEI